jgi:hypothetical protein
MNSQTLTSESMSTSRRRLPGDDEIRSYTFGAIEFKTRGLGLFFPSVKLQERIRALSPDDLRAANKAAWKLRRTAERYMNRSHFMSDWDSAGHDYHVAEQICKATWRALQS